VVTNQLMIMRQTKIHSDHNSSSWLFQDHPGSSLSEIDVVQATAYRSGHQKGSRLFSPATVCSISHMVNRGKY